MLILPGSHLVDNNKMADVLIELTEDGVIFQITWKKRILMNCIFVNVKKVEIDPT